VRAESAFFPLQQLGIVEWACGRRDDAEDHFIEALALLVSFLSSPSLALY